MKKRFYFIPISSWNTLRKHAYSNILKISPPKTESFQIKILILFHISALDIDCGYSLEPPRRGGSNEYPQSMFLSRNKKNNIYHCKPQFYYIKVGFQGRGGGGQNYIGMFSWWYVWISVRFASLRRFQHVSKTHASWSIKYNILA